MTDRCLLFQVQIWLLFKVQIRMQGDNASDSAVWWWTFVPKF